jgi:anti-anti-sigma regulatory factor
MSRFEGSSAEGSFVMNTVLERASKAMVVVPEKMTELVRGSDLRLVGDVEPLLRDKDVVLNCEKIERIDAAGIAALISLYGSAQNAGHSFRVCNLKAHVEEILALVGLDRILVACDEAWNAIPCGRLQRTAA